MTANKLIKRLLNLKVLSEASFGFQDENFCKKLL